MNKDDVLELIEEMSNQLQKYAKALTRDDEKAERVSACQKIPLKDGYIQ